ncbi:MAG: hypothetical protein AB8H80_09800 [Planctomycetota bacterium]
MIRIPFPSLSTAKSAPLLLAAASFAPSLAAQFASRAIDVDIPAQTGNALLLGVAHDPIHQQFFCTARGTAATFAAPHSVYVLDQSGNLVSTIPQSAAANATVWGYRDGASNAIGQLMFGFEGGIEVFDSNSAAPTALTPATTLLTTNGLQPISQPIVVQGGIFTTHRAIAFDADGNSGDGSIFVGNFADDVVEIDLAGNVLHTYANTSSWSAYGLALDVNKGTLWINSAPSYGSLAEYAIDRSNNMLTPTGIRIERNGALEGGLDWVDNGVDGRGCGSDLLACDQTADTLIGHRLELWDGYDPAGEPALAIGMDGGPLSETSVEVFATANSIEVDCTGPAGLPYLLFADVLGEPERARGAVAGLRSPWEMTFPRPNSVFVGGFTSGSAISLPANVLTSAPIGQEITWQGLALDGNVPVPACGLQLPLVATNVTKHIYTAPYTVEVRATGGNSFNVDPTSGFFQIEAGPLTASDPIVSVEFDWQNVAFPSQATMVFDCDQTGMLNTFAEGNGGGCGGTYRNGSDVVAGLDYTNPANNLADTAVCAGSIAHVEASNQVGTTPNYKTLKWHFAGGQFTSGVVLEFDIDTDGGAGIAGADMGGMIVTVTLASGITLTGDLDHDVGVTVESFVRL